MLKKFCAVLTLLVLLFSSVVVFAFGQHDLTDLSGRGKFGETLVASVHKIGTQIEIVVEGDAGTQQRKDVQSQEISGLTGGWLLIFGLTCFVMRLSRGRV